MVLLLELLVLSYEAIQHCLLLDIALGLLVAYSRH
jgi:hypothetical protein